MIFNHSGAPNISLNQSILDNAVLDFEAHGGIDTFVDRYVQESSRSW